ncbi:phage tail spike protein [Bacillus cereus group sp. MYBK249-1]|uniref:phage tail spike protein n=1 Tax=unclassified Bacillus cereus group TaxID=2750818 RepID=UPI003F797D6F
MRAPSGTLHVIDFKKDQIVANIQAQDYWDDIRHWEIKNNIDTLEFKVFDNTEHAATLMQQNLVLKEVRDGRIVPYVINNEAEKDSRDRSLTVRASGAWVQIAKDGYIMPQRIEGKTVNQFMDMALAGTKWKRGKTEYAGFHTMTIDTIIDPLTFLKKIASLFDLEIQYRVEVVGSQIVSWYVDMVKKRGRDTGKEVTLGKDLIGVRRIEHSRDVCTALVGFVKGEGDTIITVEKINDGLPYITDSDAFQRWNEKGKHKFGFYSPETEEQNMTPQRLLTLMKTEFAKRVNTSVVYDVEAAAIGRVFGLAHELINEGDTIRIKDTGFTPKLYLEARAIAGDESFTDPSQDKYVFGDYREITDPNEEMRRLYNRVLASLGNKANKELLEQLEILAEEAKKESEQAVRESQVAKDIAEATKEYMDQNLVDIIEAANPPTTNLKPNKTLWRDISNGKPGILKIWTGTAWESVVPDTGSLQQSIQDAENEINTLKESVKDLPDTTWINQQLEDKADKTGVYTKDYIDQNLVGKQIYETDKQGNIQKFTDMKTEIGQNAEAITQKAEKTQVDTISDNLKQVTQTANTAKQTADSNTSTITELKTTVNNISVGSINLAIGSETGLNKQNMTGTWSDSKQMTLSDKINFRNKTFTISLLFTGKMTKLNSNSWFGVETAITYADGEQEWKSVRTDSQLKINVDYKDEPLSVTFRTKDKDVIQVKFYYSGRNIDGNLNSHNAKFEEGNIRTTWQPANEEVTSKADFTKTANEIKQTVDTNSQTISTVQKDQGTMQTTLNQVKQTTDSNSQTITTLSQTQGKQGEIIQQNTSDITQLNNQIKSKVSDIQMQEYVGGLGSTNLLFNAAFEDRVINTATGAVTSRTPSTTKWSVVGTGSGITIVPESARHHEGYNSVKITATGQTASKWSGIMQRVPAVQNGGDYVFSAWVYVQDKNTLDNGGAIKLQFFNGANAVSTFVQTEFKDLLVNNSWVLVSVKITSPNVAVTHLQGDIWVRQNGTIWVAQPQLQQGSTRSTFMENPKDYANYDQLVGEIGKKVATSDFNSKVSTIETSINQQSNRIDLKAEKNDVYNKVDSDGRYGSKAMVEKHESSITLMSNEINSTVKKGDIISSINQTAEQITIDVSKLAINAATIVKWLTAEGIDTNFISVRGDKITIDKNGVTIKMLDFLFEDEWGTKTTVMPKRNLIADHDFSSVPKLNIGNSNYQGFGAGYGLPWKVQGNGVVIENNTFIFNYEQMVNAVRVDTYNYPETKVQNGIHPGNSYTLSAHYRTAQINGVRVTAKPRLQVCFVTPLDEVSYKIWHEIYKDFPEPSTFYGEIRRYNFTFTVPNNYNPQEHMIVVKVTAANAQVSAGRAVCVSGITLVSGNYACMYNWDRAAAERADGLQPFNRIAIGGVNNNIGPADHGQTFDISTEKDVFINQPILTQGINLGRNKMGQAGSIRFFDGGQGYGFYFMGMAGQWYKLPNV